MWSYPVLLTLCSSVFFVEGQWLRYRNRAKRQYPDVTSNDREPCVFRAMLDNYFRHFPRGPIDDKINVDPRYVIFRQEQSVRFYQLYGDKELAERQLMTDVTSLLFESHGQCPLMRLNQVVSSLIEHEIMDKSELYKAIRQPLLALGFGYEEEFARETAYLVNVLIFHTYKDVTEHLFQDVGGATSYLGELMTPLWDVPVDNMQNVLDKVVMKYPSILHCVSWDKYVSVNSAFANVAKRFVGSGFKPFLGRVKMILTSELKEAVPMKNVSQTVDVVVGEIEIYLDDFMNGTLEYEDALLNKDWTRLEKMLSEFLDATQKPYLTKVMTFLKSGSTVVPPGTDLTPSSSTHNTGPSSMPKTSPSDGSKQIPSNGPEQSTSNGPKPTPSNKPKPSPSNGPKPTPSNKPKPSPSNGPKTTPSNKPKPSPSNGPKLTPSNKPKPSPSNGPKPTPPNKPKPLPSNGPKPTPQNKPKPSPSNGPKPTSSKKPKPSPSNGPKLIPSNKPKPYPSNGTKPTPSNNPKLSPSNGPKLTPSNKPMPSPSNGPKPTPSNKMKPSPSNKPKPTPSSKPKPSPSNGPKPAPSNKQKPYPSNGPKPSPSNGPKPTLSNGLKLTSSNGPKPTSSNGPTPSLSNGTKPSPSNKPKPPPSNGHSNTSGGTKKSLEQRILDALKRHRVETMKLRNGGNSSDEKADKATPDNFPDFLYKLSSHFPNGPIQDTISFPKDEIKEMIRSAFKEYRSKPGKGILKKLHSDVGTKIISEQLSCPASKFSHVLSYLLREQMESNLENEEGSLASQLTKILTTTGLTFPEPRDFAEHIVTSIHNVMSKRIILNADYMLKGTSKATGFLEKSLNPLITDPYDDNKIEKLLQKVVETFPWVSQCETADDFKNTYLKIKNKFDEVKQLFDFAQVESYLKSMLSKRLKEMTGSDHDHEVNDMVKLLMDFVNEALKFATDFHNHVSNKDMDELVELFRPDLEPTELDYFKGMLRKLGFVSVATSPQTSTSPI